MNVAAIVVSFDRKHDVLGTAASLRGVVDTVLVVDNAPLGNAPLGGDFDILVNGNRGGLAGAYNLALAEIRSNHPATTHVLFLDEDTDVTSLSAFLADEVTRTAALDPGIAAVAPAYVDARTGIRGKHIQLGRFNFRMIDRMVDTPTPVTFVINSMSLWQIGVFERVGAYSENLAVDHIDTDYCLRVKALGLTILLNPRVEYRHTIGHRRAFRFLGREMQAGGHGPWRRRMIGRNTAILGRRFALKYPAFAILCASRFAYEVIGILAAEPGKRAKVTALLGGGFAGLWTRYQA